MNPVRSSLRHPQVTIAITLMLLAVGIYSLVTMPRREDPKITIRVGIVAAYYPGANAEEVENQVTRKIEEHLFRFGEVRKEKTFSTSRDGLVHINVELEDFVKNTDEFWSKLRLDLAQLKATELPSGIYGPVVDSDFGDTVAALIAVHGDGYDYGQLKDYAKRIEASLRSIRAVSKIRRIGDQQEQIEITSSMERLSQYSVNPLKVMQALQGRNTVQYAGKVPTATGDVPIKPTGPFQTEEQIRNVMVDVSPIGQPVYIGDIANVERIYKDPTQFARFDGEKTILLAVEMQEGNNIVDFGDSMRAELERVRPLLPPDLKLDFLADQPKVVSERIRHFIREFGIAIGAVILVTIILLPLRVAVIAAIAIPITIAVTFGMLNTFGIELHQVSISALIVVLGMVVDDAIVIADNYVELLDRKVPIADAAWRSATELAVPVLTATMTIVGSFVPMLMLSGSVGEFIRALPITVTIALTSSFVVAMLVTPLLCRFFIRRGLKHQAGAPKSGFSVLDWMQRQYNATIVLALRHKIVVVTAAACAIAAGAILLHFVPEQFFPSAERNQFIADIWMPSGTRIEATNQVVGRLEDRLHSIADVRDYAAFLGTSAPRFYYNVNPQYPATNYAQLLVNTTTAERTPELVMQLRGELQRIAPAARVHVKQLQQGDVMEGPVEVRIAGPDAKELRRIGADVGQIFADSGKAIYIHNDWHGDTYNLRVNVNDEVANRLGLTHGSIAQQLAGGFDGVPVTTYWEGDHDVQLVLRLDKRHRQTFQDVSDAYVLSLLTGARVPLSGVASLSPEWQPSRIVRRNGLRTYTVRAFPAENGLASDVLAAARPKIDALPLPVGYQVSYGGEIESQKETFGELVHALGVSLILIYLILLFQFRSMVEPLIVMASIPLALPGAAIGLFITHNPFGFTAFMGIVSLGGVVVRNAIILIDYIRERISHGVPIEQAALEAGERRLRPIFLTTMAAAVGVSPMIASGSTLWSPLASAIAFGLIGSMFCTLVVIPVLYILLHRFGSHASKAVATAVVLLCVAPSVRAEALKMTLDEAVKRATSENSVAKLARLKVKEQEAKIAGARANLYPQITNTTNAIRFGEDQRLEIPMGALGVYPAAGPIPGAPVSVLLGSKNLLLATTTVAQPLTQLWKIRAGIDVANADKRIARADESRARDELALKTKELFYNLLALEKRSEAVRLQISAGEARLAETQDAVDSGTILQVRVLEGHARLAEARHGLDIINDSLADLRIEFNNLVGLPLDSSVELDPAKPAKFDASGVSTWVQNAIAHNPEIIAAKESIAKTRSALRAARAEFIPDIALVGEYVYQHGVPFLAENNAAVGLRLNLNIWDFGKRRSGIREREAQLEQAEENLRRVSDHVRIDVEKAIRKVRRAEDGIETIHTALAARQELLRLASDQVEAGVSTRAARLEAQATFASAEADLRDAELNHAIAVAELAKLLGQ